MENDQIWQRREAFNRQRSAEHKKAISKRPQNRSFVSFILWQNRTYHTWSVLLQNGKEHQLFHDFTFMFDQIRVSKPEHAYPI